MEERFLRRSDVERMAGLSKATIYRRIKDGSFPSPYRIDDKCVRWRKTELIRWQDRQPIRSAANDR